MKLLFTILTLAITLRAQELAPEIAARAATQKRESVAISEGRSSAINAAKSTYLALVDAADRSSTAAGDLLAIKAVTKERELIKSSNSVADDFPENLPKSLQGPRKTLARSLERLENEWSQRQKAVDSAYLRHLASVQPKAASNPALAAQIVSEKERLMRGAFGPITDLTTSIEGTTWHRIGARASDVIRFGKNGIFNDNWKYEVPSRTEVRIIWHSSSSITLTLGKDGKTLIENGKVTFELVQPAAK